MSSTEKRLPQVSVPAREPLGSLEITPMPTAEGSGPFREATPQPTGMRLSSGPYVAAIMNFVRQRLAANDASMEVRLYGLLRFAEHISELETAHVGSPSRRRRGTGRTELAANAALNPALNPLGPMPGRRGGLGDIDRSVGRGVGRNLHQDLGGDIRQDIDAAVAVANSVHGLRTDVRAWRAATSSSSLVVHGLLSMLLSRLRRGTRPTAAAMARSRIDPAERYGRLLDQVLKTYPYDAGPNIDLAMVWDLYLLRKQIVYRAAAAPMQRLVRGFVLRYCDNHRLVEPAALLPYLGKLVLLSAAVQFLVISHPRMQNAFFPVDVTGNARAVQSGYVRSHYSAERRGHGGAQSPLSERDIERHFHQVTGTFMDALDGNRWGWRMIDRLVPTIEYANHWISLLR